MIMEKDEKNEGKAAAMAAALDKANKEAGYDIPLAFAALNAITIQGQTEQRMPLFESRCDLTAAVDVVMRASGSTLTDDGLAMLLNFAVAYGYHYAKDGESLVRSEAVKEKILAFVDANEKIPIVEKGQRKEAIGRGYEAMMKAIAKAISRLKIQRAIKK
ncbi:MAG: hypothetical protein IKZ56_02735 [Bacteroidales bacterium]|nr:hypothetical protein [Bacteroidales bacterium]